MCSLTWDTSSILKPKSNGIATTRLCGFMMTSSASFANSSTNRVSHSAAAQTPAHASRPSEVFTSLTHKPWQSTFIWICPDGYPRRPVQTRSQMAGRPWLDSARRTLLQTGSKSTSVLGQRPRTSVTKNPIPSDHGEQPVCISHTRLHDAEFEVWRGLGGSGDPPDSRRGRRRYSFGLRVRPRFAGHARGSPLMERRQTTRFSGRNYGGLLGDRDDFGDTEGDILSIAFIFR